MIKSYSSGKEIINKPIFSNYYVKYHIYNSNNELIYCENDKDLIELPIEIYRLVLKDKLNKDINKIRILKICINGENIYEYEM